jgi:hypothetical protein
MLRRGCKGPAGCDRHDAGMTTRTETTVVDRLLASIEAASVPAELYAPDARLDAVVPGWRFELVGGDAIAAEFGRWFDHPGTLEELRREPTATGEVVEYTVAWEEDGMPYAARHIHLLEVDDLGRIRSDHVWCGGRWPSPLLAQMEAARDDG